METKQVIIWHTPDGRIMMDGPFQTFERVNGGNGRIYTSFDYDKHIKKYIHDNKI